MMSMETCARRVTGVVGLALVLGFGTACSSPEVTPTAVVEAASSASPTTNTATAASMTPPEPTSTATAEPVAAARVATTTPRATSKPQLKSDDTVNRLVVVPQRVTSAKTATKTTTKTATSIATKTATKSSDESDGSSAGTVHPGSFCSHGGAGGLTNKGTTMVCQPGSDGKLRWGKA